MTPAVLLQRARESAAPVAELRARVSAAHLLCVSRAHRGSDSVLFACVRCRRDINEAAEPNLFERGVK